MPSAFSRSGIRYTCDEPEPGESYVEYNPRWSRAEYRQLIEGVVGETEEERQQSSADWLALVRAKITAIRLLCADGNYLDDPADLTEQNLDRVDIVIYQWWANTPWALRMELANTGEALRRRLFATSVAVETKQTETEPA